MDAQSSDPDDHGRLSGPESSLGADAMDRCRNRSRKDASLFQRDGFRNLTKITRRDTDILSEPTIFLEPDSYPPSIAVVLMAGTAVVAVPAGDIDMDDPVITRVPSLNSRPDVGHFSGQFVSHDPGKLHRIHVAIENLDIGRAKTASAYSKQEISLADGRLRDLFINHGLPEPFQNHCFHSFKLLLLIIK